MPLCAVERDAECSRDLAVRLARRDQFEHFALAAREVTPGDGCGSGGAPGHGAWSHRDGTKSLPDPVDGVR